MYIKQSRRLKLWPFDEKGPEIPDTNAELAYQIVQAAVDFVSTKKGYDQSTFIGVLGAFDYAKQEFYRRVVAPYADEKKKEQGDVFYDDDKEASE